MMETRKSFYKLFGKYDQDLKKGRYSVLIENSKYQLT